MVGRGGGPLKMDAVKVRNLINHFGNLQFAHVSVKLTFYRRGGRTLLAAGALSVWPLSWKRFCAKGGLRSGSSFGNLMNYCFCQRRLV